MKQLKSPIPGLLLALIVFGLSSSSALGSATIIIQNNDGPNEGFNDTTPATPVGGNTGTTVGQQRLNSFTHAAGIWGQTLTSGPTIVIRASWSPLTCTATSGTLGSAGAVTFSRNFPGAPVTDTWYIAALANALSNTDTNNNAEISAQFNANLGTPGCLENASWYYGLDTNNNGSQVNLVTVLLHEFAHGLGFATITNSGTGLQLNGFPSIYDRFLLDNVSGKTWNQMTDTERVASAINTGNLVWNGAQATADAVILFNGKDPQGHPQMFAPNPRVAGSSVSHWSNVTAPNQLMEPNNSFGLSHSVTTPQDLTFSLLRDIGWCAGCPQPPPPSPTPTPVPPANDNFASAQLISGCSGSVTGTNVGATKETGEPAHLPISSGSTHSVWYQWQAPSNGNVTITTENSDYDTTLAVYTGSSLGGLSLVANDDDSGPGTTSSVSFAGTAGVIYRIAVDGFDNDSGGDTGNIRLNWSQANCTSPPPNTVAFNTMNLSVGEGAGSYQIAVSRTDTTAAATVNYSTSDTAGLTACGVFNGVASERCDYATTVGTLRFAAGEATKTITIPIVNDVHVEGNETFTIALSLPVGVTLGTPNSVVVTIADDDTIPGTPNPIEGVDLFITQQYIDFLGRLPDAGGFANWKATLGGCPNGGFGEFDNPTCDRVHVSAGFFLSEEFRGRGYWAYRFYEVGFDRRPNYTEFVPDMAKVGGAQSPESEVLSKAQYTTDFGLRPEFMSRYNSMTNAAYVNALEQQAEITLADKQALINALTAGTTTRVDVLRNIVERQAVEDRFFIRAFVAMQYFGYLRRDPDTVGYNNWVATLTANPADFRHMIFGFIYSDEYRLRFGQ